MIKISRIKAIGSGAFLVIILLAASVSSDISIEGDFRVRAYTDDYEQTLDNRGTENYMRYFGRVRAKAPVNQNTSFYVELLTQIENNPLSPVRSIAGTGKMQYGISQIFAELLMPDLLVFDVVRLRVGRQQFPIGNGLSMGESYYFYDLFDAVRFDFAFGDNSLSAFGAITGQNVSASGLYPDPGSDQLYALRLTRPVMGQSLMGYYIYQKLRGHFNDNYIFGGGLSGDFKKGRLTYFLEMAAQDFNTIDGIPEKGGIGYMAGTSYRWTAGPFSSIKVESRYAAYQGDDADTRKVEQFSPPYPSFFWGSRDGYVNGAIGGDFPYNGRNPEGSRLWYSRIYFIHKRLPKLRLQFQYIKIDEYVDNDDYNTMDDEFSVNMYYTLSPQTQLQLRLSRSFPNGHDGFDDNGKLIGDVNGNGQISWSEDRLTLTRFMAELQVKF